MALRISCPSCKSAYVIDDSMRGKRILCRDCQKPMNIPAPPMAKPLAPSASGDTSIVEFKANVVTAQAVPVVKPAAASIPRHEESDRPPQNRRGGKAQSNQQFWLLLAAGAAGLGIFAVFVIAIVVIVVMRPGAESTGADTAAVVKAPPVQVAEIANKSEPKSEAKNDPQPAQASPPKPQKQPVKQKPAADKPLIPSNNGQLDREVLAKVKRATVYIRVTMAGGGGREGSGFFAIERGLVLTNAHVLDMLDPESLPPSKVEIVYQSGEKDSRTFVGKLLGVDHDSDLALLRVEGSNLPEPLDVKYTSDLIETQTVYVVGFPFGKFLGSNITVSASSVSSLRKAPSGEIVEVQVNGGMNPGNSGGPVVNTSGEVIGVAVAVLTNTQINFAVPGDFVHVVLNGRVTAIRMDPPVLEGSQLKLPVSFKVLDPLSRVQRVSCEWWTGKNATARPWTGDVAAPEAGDSPHKRLDLQYKDGIGKVEIGLPPQLPKDHVVWIQAMIVDAEGNSKWVSPKPFTPSGPLEKKPAILALKHFSGARPVTLTSNFKVKLSKAGVPNLEVTMGLSADMTESMMNQDTGNALLRMRYQRCQMRLPSSAMLKDDTRLQNTLDLMKLLHTDLVIDEKNNLKKNNVDLPAKLPKETGKELTDLHKLVHESLETLSVPLPGRMMQPGETWTATRPLMVFTGNKGESSPMEVTYTFQGIRQENGRTQGVIDIVALAQDRRGGGQKITGKVTGIAHLDIAASQISMAHVKAQLTVGEGGGGGESTVVTLDSKMQRLLGKELLKLNDRLTAQDPRGDKNRPQKSHFVQLEGGKPCVISMESPKVQGGFDTYLRVEDNNGKVLAEDDDGGVDLNSMIVFTPPTTGMYRVVATCFEPAVGAYLLVVRQ